MSFTTALDGSRDPQAHRFWLKETASWNMDSKSRALETFQDETSWLKEDAPRNVDWKSPTRETSQEETSWLKEVAYRNIVLIPAALLVFHLERS